MADELFSIEARHDGRKGLLRATDAHVIFDVRDRKGTWDRVVDVPLAEVREVEVDELRAEETRRRSGLIGIWVKQTVGARSGILLVRRDGTRLVFEVDGAPLQAKAALGRLLDLV